MLEEYTQALAIMRDFVAQAPVRPWGHAMLAVILAQVGRAEEAKTETAETLRLDSTFMVSAKSVAAFKPPRP
jgi:predicted Zn-dependent protease